MRRLRQWRRALGRARPVADQGGQTLTEYSILMGVVGGGFAYTAIEFLPNFIDALQRYYDGFYVMLNLPFP
jgi:hypothetical protein